MHPDDRAKMEAELRANGFIHVEGIPYTEKQIALLTWHKLDELSGAVANLESDRITRTEVERMFDKVRKHTFTAIGSVVGLGTLIVTILSATH